MIDVLPPRGRRPILCKCGITIEEGEVHCPDYSADLSHCTGCGRPLLFGITSSLDCPHCIENGRRLVRDGKL